MSDSRSTPEDPARAGSTSLPESPACPFCEGRDTELFNAFGSQLSVSTYWCRSCRSPFEFMKWGRSDVGYARPGTDRDRC